MRIRPVVAALCALASVAPARALDLHKERSSPFDLAVAGRLAGVPAGEERYASWADLRAMPTEKLTVNGEFIRGPQVLTVVFLDVLWKALPVTQGADTLLATCSDGYASVFTSEFVGRYRPFLVLEINGKGPKDWPPPGLAYNPGPFVISVSTALVPEAAKYRDLEHKKPWGVTRLEAASYADRFSGIYSGEFAVLSAPEKDGREIWVNSCASCHEGPSGIFGGTKAGRPFQIIRAFARYDRPFFEGYVRDPKSLVPSAQMEAHPRYTDAEMAGLVAFIAGGL
jgi:cytochrome c2